MTTLDYAARMLIVIAFGMTCVVSLIRSVRSDDSRVVKGALLVAAFTSVGVYAQIPLWHEPLNTTDWLRVALSVLCLIYLRDLHKKGLN